MLYTDNAVLVAIAAPLIPKNGISITSRIIVVTSRKSKSASPVLYFFEKYKIPLLMPVYALISAPREMMIMA